MSHVTFPKPLKGTAKQAHHQTRLDRTAHEQREMQAALKRDGKKCRVPRCEFAKFDFKIDPCHQNHRGMGGNPSGDRTTRATIISLCRRHHDLYDRGVIDIEPLTAKQFDGPCSFFATEGDRREHYATERIIGVSEVPA